MDAIEEPESMEIKYLSPFHILLPITLHSAWQEDMKKITFYLHQTTLKEFQIVTGDSLVVFTLYRLFDRNQILGQQHNFPQNEK